MTQSTNAATDHVQSLIEITQSLTEIFGKENDLLTKRRPGDIAPLQAEKARLAAAYAQSIKDIAANRSIVHGADHALLKELRVITRSFEKRAAAQRALLDGAQRASEGVVKAVAAEAAAAEEPAYSGEQTAQGNAAPISVDENA